MFLPANDRSDTTATALTFLFIHLALYPEWLQRLREEIDLLLATSSSFDCTRSYPVLDALINECMRLHPSVFFGSQRETPPEGMTIGEVYIPGNTIVSIPSYQIGRGVSLTIKNKKKREREITDMYVSDERNFVRAKEFLPERWLSKPELILNRHAHMPFLTGPYSCAGRNLAMMELRSVIARTVHAFDIAFPDGTAFDPEEYFSRVKDHFVAGAPAQELLFTRRSDRMAD